ncbi:MAG: class I SAM-dependent methyltransferase [Clostridiales bacterium]|jgi:SAM-dependent methyltransferase|nr:class I SAM-dependent methyltransferase [Clostridiales bacterium]
MMKEPRRPGGIALTRRALELCAFGPGARLADIGCGDGTSVDYLRGAGFDATGVDSDPRMIARAGPFCLAGDARAIPFATASLDGMLFECVLSLINPIEEALYEAARCLIPGGKLIVSDLYARRAAYGGALPGIEQWTELFTKAGFTLLTFEDRSIDLKEYAAKLLWDRGNLCADNLCGYGIDELKAAKCGYFLAVAISQTNVLRMYC